MTNFKLPDTPSFIAVILVVSIVLLVFTLAFLGGVNSQVFNVLVGGLMSVGFTNIVGYYFGSSSSSKAKDETISTLAVNASGTGSGGPAAVTAAAAAAAPAAAKEAAPAAAKEAAPPAADVAAPPAAEIAVEHALAERDAEHKP
jgi:hypothetical protein